MRGSKSFSIPFYRFNLTGTRKHVLHDLEPYVCTYDKCTEPDRKYDNREAWFNHESQHYSAYFCGIPAHQNHDNLISFCDHMSSVHSTSIDHNGDISKWEIFLRRVRRLTGQCSLCGQPTDHLKHHTGRHLERIAFSPSPKLMLQRTPERSNSGSLMSLWAIFKARTSPHHEQTAVCTLALIQAP